MVEEEKIVGKTNGEIIREAFTAAWKWIRLLIALVLLYTVIQFVSLQKLYEALQHADYRLVAVALLIMPLHLALQTYKWYYLLRTTSRDIKWRTAARSVLFGIALGIVTPGQLGEFIGRAFSISTHHRPLLTGLAIVDKIQNMVVLTIGGCIALPILLLPNSMTTVAVGIILAAFALLIAFRLEVISKIVLTIVPPRFHAKWLIEACSSADILSPRSRATTLGFSVIFYIIVFVQMQFLLSAFEPAHLLDSSLAYGATMFTKALLPVAVGDIGVRELTALYFYSRVGISSESAVNASLLLFAINVAIPSIVGSFFIPPLFAKFRQTDKQS